MTYSAEKESRFSWPVESASSAADTWIFPLVQMGQLGVETDSACTRRILESIPADAEMSLATGYFNLTQDYMDSILNVSRANVHILMAHPSVSIHLIPRATNFLLENSLRNQC